MSKYEPKIPTINATNNIRIVSISVDPAEGCCYWDSTKPCKFALFREGGELLSNTSIILP